VGPGRPSLDTARLVLRPFRSADAPLVQQYASAVEVASTTLNIPHPYDIGMAEAWIATQGPSWERKQSAVFAISDRTSALVGAIGLQLQLEHRRGEIGYWIGVPFWGQGYATEAALAVVQFGFESLELRRIHAAHLIRNPASARVLIKAGMRFEGCLRQHVVKWGQSEDVGIYGILRSEWRGEG
jgi:RimJ/RimL family protein N-acetyltransferase